MNLPNVLTLARIFFVPLLVGALVLQNAWIALAIFLVAGATDLLDGYLARRWRQVTTVGTLLDPIADKLLVSAALVSLVQLQALPAWMAIIVIGREFAMSGLRSIAAAEGYVIRANDLGKLKLVTQVAALSMLMIGLEVPAMRRPANFAMWLVVTFSLLSAIVYFRKFWRQIDDSIKRRSRRDILRDTQR